MPASVHAGRNQTEDGGRDEGELHLLERAQVTGALRVRHLHYQDGQKLVKVFTKVDWELPGAAADS